ncbi:coagulation factor XIII B chain isoform X2 [Anolis carolinensis]|uniref:coagulation factor XIII B chain isoform X2 n=1 Tax=Anolis carolinensis TaxID=28377 RepID=UPI002F2B3207
MRNWLICIVLFLLWTCCISQGEITCEPPNIAHGRVRNSKPIYQNGERIQISCNDEYKPADRDDATCTQDGWNTSVECIGIVCQQPQIDNGDIKPKQSLYQYQDQIDTFCDEGYSNSDSSFCTAKGWQPPPACTAKQCEYPHIQNGRLYYNEWEGSFPKRLGYRLDFICNNGFLPKSKDSWHSSYCTIRGWNPEPKCFKKCDHPQQIQHGAFNYHRWSIYIEGDDITLSCDTGYYPANQQTKIMCTKNGWSPTPSCVSPVDVEKCGRPPSIENGDIHDLVKEQYESGERVIYKCQRFYNMEGNAAVNCQNGNWSDTPKCIDVTCREPPVVANGDILVARSQVYLPGQEVRYECHEGFEIFGPKIVRCDNKAWSEPPTCEDGCPPPPDILHGQLRGNKKQKYSPNETMEYQCDNGYYISGSRTITCLKKQWSEAPQCRANVEKCGRPPSIENGDIIDLLKDEYKSGERVIYKCQRFYNMEGNAAVSCQNGHWSDTPKCIVPCTASQEDMERNNIRLRWTGKDKLYFTAGDVAEFACKWGYRPHPSSPEFRVRCVNDTFEYPRCIRI